MIESSAKYRLLKEFPGLRARNPLGIAVINDFEDEIADVYTACFYLPSVKEETPFCIKATSASEVIAYQGLAQKIADYYHELKQKSVLSRDESLQKNYLDSIFQG